MYEQPIISPEYKDVSVEVLSALPKVVLTDHVEGGIRPSTFLEFAEDASVTLPEECTDADSLRTWAMKQPSEQLRGIVNATLDKPEKYTQLIREALEDLSRDNVVYAELTIWPQLVAEKHDLDVRELIDAAARGMSAREVYGIQARLLVRIDPDAPGGIDALHALIASDRGVVAGAMLHPTDNQVGLQARDMLHRNLIPFTVAAWPLWGIGAVHQGAGAGGQRLSHAIALTEDFSVSSENFDLQLGKSSAWVRDRRMTLELAPTLAIHEKAAKSYSDHPVGLFFELGFRLTVSPAVRLITDSTMTSELMNLVEHCDFGLEELFQITVDAVESAFLPYPQRQQIIQSIILPAYERLEDSELAEHVHDEELDLGDEE
ncbi:hypothetical protein [Corynebacterium renale]|uniref:adenosine deaminase n=1 Tax=Corynebacterium renale TaxID=1724 RepID=A0A2A9DLT2_9CORY|nr:hypothetical protein [Corynebacterium renale]PFG27135.1 adenosine deaminase [Corynebacterium renale]SQI24046.1 adenosine deaminase [Corynebacterium renale]